MSCINFSLNNFTCSQKTDPWQFLMNEKERSFFFFSGLFIGSSTLKILARMSRDASLENDLYCSHIRLRTNDKQTIAWLPNLHFLMQIILRKVSGIPLSVNDVMSYLWNRQRHRIKRGNLNWSKTATWWEIHPVYVSSTC